MVYQLSGGTVPTEETGADMGSWDRGFAVIDFSSAGSESLSSVDMKAILASDASIALAVSGTSGNIDVSGQSHGITLSAATESSCGGAACLNSVQNFDGALEYSFIGSDAARFAGSYYLQDSQASGSFNSVVGTLVFDQVPDSQVNYQLAFSDAQGNGIRHLPAGSVQSSVTDATSSAFDLLSIDDGSYHYLLLTDTSPSLSYTLSNSSVTSGSDRISWGKWSSGDWVHSVDNGIQSDGDTLPLFFTASDHILTMDNLPVSGRFIYNPVSLNDVLLVNAQNELVSVSEHYFILDYSSQELTDFVLNFSSNTDNYAYGMSGSSTAPATGDSWSFSLADGINELSGSGSFQLSGDNGQRALATYQLAGSASDSGFYGVSGYQATEITLDPLPDGAVALGSLMVTEGGVNRSYLLQAEALTGGDILTTESLNKTLISGSLINGEISNQENTLSHCSASGCSFDLSSSGSLDEYVSDGASQIFYGRYSAGWSIDFDGTPQSSVNSFHYIYSPDISTQTELDALTGFRLYQLVNGSTATNETGNAASQVAGGMAILDFDYDKIRGLDIDQVFSTDNWYYTAGTDSFSSSDATHSTVLSGQLCTDHPCSPSDTQTGKLGYSFVGNSGDFIIAAYEAGNASTPSSQSGAVIYQTVPVNSYDYQFVFADSAAGPSPGFERIQSNSEQSIIMSEQLAPLFATYKDSSNQAHLLNTSDAASFTSELLIDPGGAYIEWGYWDSGWTDTSLDSVSTGTKLLMYSATDSVLGVTDLAGLSNRGEVRYNPVSTSSVYISSASGGLVYINSSYFDIDLTDQTLTDFNLNVSVIDTPRTYDYVSTDLSSGLSSLFGSDNSMTLNLKTSDDQYTGGTASIRFNGPVAEYALAGYKLPASSTDGDWLYGVGGYEQSTMPVTGSGLVNVAFLSSDDGGSSWSASSVPVDSTVSNSSFDLQLIGQIDNVPVSGATDNTSWNNAPGDFSVDTGTASLSDDGGLISGTNAMNWGFWSDTGLTLNENSNSVSTGGFHYVYSPNIEAPQNISQTGMLRYTLGGGTSPTSQSGASGGLTDVQMMIDYGRQEIVSLDMVLNHSGQDWLVYQSGGPVSLVSADRFQQISLGAYQKDASSTTMAGQAHVGLLGTSADLVSGSYQLLKSSNDYGLTGVFGLNQNSLSVLPDVFLTPVALSGEVNLLNLEGQAGYIQSSTEFQLPTYADIQGYCGGGGSEECRLLTQRTGPEPVNAGSVQNLTWGAWSSSDWSLDSVDTAVSSASVPLPFITSPKTAVFNLDTSLRGLVYRANNTNMQVYNASGGAATNMEAYLAID